MQLGRKFTQSKRAHWEQLAFTFKSDSMVRVLPNPILGSIKIGVNRLNGSGVAACGVVFLGSRQPERQQTEPRRVAWITSPGTLKLED